MRTDGADSATTRWTYDKADNRLTEIVVSTGAGAGTVARGYTYDGRNQLRTVTDSVAGLTTLTYDPQGNLSRKVKGSDTTAFVWNARDLLDSVSRNGTVLGRYSSDFTGMRVQKEALDPLQPGAPPRVLRTQWDDENALQDRDVLGNVIARYDFAGGHPVALWSAEDGNQMLHADALGSIVATTATDGSVKSETLYDAWGNPTTKAGASANKFAFTGHQADAETGFYYFKARYYDPEIGRFISVDPAEGQDLRPPSYHKYLYAYGNPLVYVDPDGREGCIFTPIFSACQRSGPVGPTPLDPDMLHPDRSQPSVVPGIVDFFAGGMRGAVNVWNDYVVGRPEEKIKAPRAPSVEEIQGRTKVLMEAAKAAVLAHDMASHDKYVAEILSLEKQHGRIVSPYPPLPKRPEGFLPHPIQDQSGITGENKGKPGVREDFRPVGKPIDSGQKSGASIPGFQPRPDDHRGHIISTPIGDMTGPTVMMKEADGSPSKRGPKPKGEGPHNETRDRRIEELKQELGPDWLHTNGGSEKESFIRTPEGRKTSRRPDITFQNQKTGEKYYEQIGKNDAKGVKLKREQEAIEDIKKVTGVEPKFTPYNK